MPELYPNVVSNPTMPARLPVFDGETFECWVTEDRARELIRNGEVDLLRTKKKIRALRVRHSGRAFSVTPTTGGRNSRASGANFAEPHKRENYYNVRGVWHIDRVPTSA